MTPFWLILVHMGLTMVAAQDYKALAWHQPSFPTSYAWDYRDENAVDYDFRTE